MIAKVQTEDRNINQLQSNITSALNYLFQNPLLNGTILTSVTLAIGANKINHQLGRTLQGWLIVRQRASATVFDTQDSNTVSGTLALTASAAVVVDLYVF